LYSDVGPNDGGRSGYVYRSGVGLLTDGDVDEFKVGESELTQPSTQ